ncbi:MAG: carboxypeptidase-like regulatory domain-containing protein [Bacteroidetes bacterium]|nr:MAG: carboxypeptidase-like regulatory domain-containing protein [Bacteroidota bacterium]
MKLYVPMQNIKTRLLFFVLLIPGLIFSQSQKGKILSSETNSGIGFVNVGIIGKNVGTVSDDIGNFIINLDKIFDNDSLRFSMIGYESKTFLVSQFRNNSIKAVYLKPRSYELQEVKVIYRKTKEIRLGIPIISSKLNSGFAYNNLGAELGINVDIEKQVKLKDINLNVAICTFDSVTYRLNIYQIENLTEYRNILTEPIYISFSKDKINDVITFDLRRYSIIIEGNVLITLELYKDLGEGKLLFHTEPFISSTYTRKTSEGKWNNSPGVVGIYLHGQLIK